ncbi:MAG: nuclear transport factor 2 family protein [Ferruginibacter sp.]
MRLLIPIIYILIFSSRGFSQASADTVALKDLIRSDYTALGNSDIDTHIKNCTADYTLIENGEIWDLKKEVEYMKSKSGLKTIRKDSFDFKSLVIADSFAYAIYELKSHITRDGITQSYHWTESVVFRKVNDSWKIQLIHSTKLND